MKKGLVIVAIFLLPALARAQENYLVTVDQLLGRVKDGKDTTFVINFWATWCAPCVKELPCFENLQEKFKHEKLKVLLVSVDFKSELTKSVIPFVVKKKLKNEVWLLNEQDQQAFIGQIDKNWSGAIPATLFIKAGQRKFFEKQFNCSELIEEYKNRTL
jgi:thiol-disulfide isomerase/thioredoxin